MSRAVAIDTATWWGGVALVESSPTTGATQAVAEAGLWVRDSHAAHLLGLLERLLAEAGWSKSSIDAYAATRGPGSFTGIRVGLGTVRGLALAAKRPCLGITSLLAMAEAHGPAEAERVPLLDAGRGEVYGARYDAASSPPLERTAPWIGPPRRALSGGDARCVLLGNGADLHFGGPRDPQAAWRVARAPTSVAGGVGRLALLRLADGAADGEGLSPLYLRPPDAELHGRRR